MKEATHASRIFQSLPRAWSAGSTPRPGTLRKNLAPRVRGLANVAKKAKPVPRGEEWHTVQRAVAGDSDALTALFARDRVRLYRTAFSLLRNKEDAEDALQDGFVAAYVNLKSFQGRARFSTWLTRIVLNAALMSLRKLRIHTQVSFDEAALGDKQHWVEAVMDGCPNPEQAYAQTENKNFVEKRLNRLSPRLRTAIQLRDLHHFSIREAAQVERVTMNVIKSRIFRARRQLADSLTPSDVNL
jgi:RNA polymerase sigma factor (sigma-70 family)